VSLSDHYTPAQIAQFDQERSAVSATLTFSVQQIRDFIADDNGATDAELYVGLIQQLAGLDGIKAAALLTEAMMRLAKRAP